MFGTLTVPVTFVTAFVPIIIGLKVIDLRIRYFAPTYKARDAEILVTYTSAGVSLMP